MEFLTDVFAWLLVQGVWIITAITIGALYIVYIVRGMRALMAVALGSSFGMMLYFLQDVSVPTWLPVTDILFQRILASVLVVGTVVACFRVLCAMHGNVASVGVAIAGGVVGVGIFLERLFGIVAVPEVLFAVTGSLLSLLWWATVLLLLGALFFLERKQW
jgi:hypothetical protein